LKFGVYIDGSLTEISTGSVIIGNQWEHIAMSREGTTFRIFYEGDLAVSASSAIVIPSVTGARLGASSDGVWSGTIMEEFRFHTKAAERISAFDPPTAAFSAVSSPATWQPLQSVAFTANQAPTIGKLLFIYQQTGTIVVGTTVRAFQSIDGGSTFTSEAAISEIGNLRDGSSIMSSDDIDLSGLSANTSIVYKIEVGPGVTAEIIDSYVGWA